MTNRKWFLSFFLAVFLMLTIPAQALADGYSHIALSPKELTICGLGVQQTIQADNVPEGANVVWTSTDYNVVSVKNGIITTVGPGTAIVKAICRGFADVCTIQVTAHNPTVELVLSPTVREEGSLKSSCHSCGKVENIVLPPLNSKDYTVDAQKEATCSVAGRVVYTWNNTQYGQFQFEVRATSGHQYNYTLTKEPTFTASGTISGTCKNCGIVSKVIMPPLDDENYVVTAGARQSTYAWKNTKFGNQKFTVPNTRILEQPKAQHTFPGAVTSFSVNAGSSPVTYQWEYLKKGSSVWTRCPASMEGSNTAVLELTAAPEMNGNLYRCIILDGSTKLVSEAAELFVAEIAAFNITAQPKDCFAALNETAFFSVTASGIGLHYQWQTRAGSGTWADCTDIPGCTTKTISPNATAQLDGTQYRCVISDGMNSVISSTAALRLSPSSAAASTEDTPIPASTVQDLEKQNVAPGETAAFTVTEGKAGTTYQWQISTDGMTWKNLLIGTKSKLSFKAALTQNGCQYRCMMTNGTDIQYSVPVLLTVSEPSIEITSQPLNQRVSAGESVTFSVSAVGSGLSYQWQYRNGSDGWKNCTSVTSGYNSNVLSLAATSGKNGYQYRCVITDQNGSTVNSGTALLLIK